MLTWLKGGGTSESTIPRLHYQRKKYIEKIGARKGGGDKHILGCHKSGIFIYEITEYETVLSRYYQCFTNISSTLYCD